MFCPKCGAQIIEEATFCVECGWKVADRKASAGSAPHLTPSSVPPSTTGYRKEPAAASAIGGGDSGSNRSKALGGVGIVLALLTFMPWISVNAYIVGDDYSLFDFVGLVMKLNESSGEMLYFLAGSTRSLGSITAITVALAVMWVATVALLVVNAVRVFQNKESWPAAFAFAAALALSVLIVILGAASTLGQASSVLSTTVWPWITLIASAACLVAQLYFNSKDA